MEKERTVEPGRDRSVGSGYCEGYGLLDPLGQEIGRVDKVFGNGDGEPQYVRVRMGLFGQRLVLIPVLDVAVDHERRSLTLR